MATVVVLFPFISKLEKLVCYLVKDSAEELEDVYKRQLMMRIMQKRMFLKKVTM